MLIILVRKENEQDQAHIFQDKYFQISQIYHLTIMYCFDHINHDNLFKIFKNFFCAQVIHISNI